MAAKSFCTMMLVSLVKISQLVGVNVTVCRRCGCCSAARPSSRDHAYPSIHIPRVRSRGRGRDSATPVPWYC